MTRPYKAANIEVCISRKCTRISKFLFGILKKRERPSADCS
nr:MAG TPA: hypothetical protein [Caudoviricetes sp.]